LEKIGIAVKDINETPTDKSMENTSQFWEITKMTATVIFWEFDDGKKRINLQYSWIVSGRRQKIANDDFRQGLDATVNVISLNMAILECLPVNGILNL
jgi:hypothetical protein